MPETRLMVLSS